MGHRGIIAQDFLLYHPAFCVKLYMQLSGGGGLLQEILVQGSVLLETRGMARSRSDRQLGPRRPWRSEESESQELAWDQLDKKGGVHLASASNQPLSLFAIARPCSALLWHGQCRLLMHMLQQTAPGEADRGQVLRQMRNNGREGFFCSKLDAFPPRAGAKLLGSPIQRKPRSCGEIARRKNPAIGQ